MVSKNIESDIELEVCNSIFESKDDKESHTLPHNPPEESINNPTKSRFKTLREKLITIQQHTHLVPLIMSMIIVVVLLQIPTILYYTDPPSAEVVLLDNVDFESCSVS